MAHPGLSESEKARLEAELRRRFRAKVEAQAKGREPPEELHEVLRAVLRDLGELAERVGAEEEAAVLAKFDGRAAKA